VDVGGTNTDAVIMDGPRVLAATKRPTTEDVSRGIQDAIRAVIDQLPVGPGGKPPTFEAVMIGTTHFVNAFIQAQGLARVAAIRLGFPASRSIRPFVTWPARLRAAVMGHDAILEGGFQFDGSPITPLSEASLRETAREIADKGIDEIAVTSIFAQLNSEQEERAAEILQDELPGASITQSNRVGRLGLLERENAAIMNASLRPLAAKVAAAIGQALAELGINAPFFVSQNDGTLMSAAHLLEMPVLTFAAGPTNSLRGAYFLAGVPDALVADIGGTTTDVGVILAGFPRQSGTHVDVGGIRTNFRMPDILSVGLGGGSRVTSSDDRVAIGPTSVGYRLSSEALVFGGSVLTATDLAVAAGHLTLGDPKAVSGLDPEMVRRGVDEFHRRLADAIDRMKTGPVNLPLLLVGGGAALVGQDVPGVPDVIRPGHADVANAVGAAIGQVSGEVDRTYNCDERGRGAAIEDARSRAIQAAINAGADPPSVAVIEMEDIPLQYLPGGARRIICRAIGDLAGLGEGHGGVVAHG
jgi:N-methylhydantoinase A/oxoprolinase/acetone carboxylase beta subunit